MNYESKLDFIIDELIENWDDSTPGVITEEESLQLCEDDIEGKQNNKLGLDYQVKYLPIVVGVDRYDKIQDVSTVLLSHLLDKEYIK